MRQHPKDKTLLFFDEVCEFCWLFIQFIAKRDKKKLFLFSPLQGETAKHYLVSKDIHNLSSVVVHKNNKIYREGEALKHILKELYPYSSLLLRGIPCFLINKIYRFIAKRRYYWFGIRKNKVSPDSLKKELLP